MLSQFMANNEKFIITIKSKMKYHSDDPIIINSLDDLKIENGFLKAYDNGKEIYAYATEYIAYIEIMSSLYHPTKPL